MQRKTRLIRGAGWYAFLTSAALPNFGPYGASYTCAHLVLGRFKLVL